MSGDAQNSAGEGGILAWQSQHERLLEALDVELHLDAVRQALGISPEHASRAADAHLLGCLRQEHTLHSGLSQLAAGQPDVLRKQIDAAFPAGLNPEVVHHLSLVWLRSSDPELQFRGRFGMLHLIARRTEYLQSIGQMTASPDIVEDVLQNVPAMLLEPLLSAVRRVGGPDEPENGREAHGQLERLVESLQHDGMSGSEVARDLAELLASARATAVETVIEVCKSRLTDAEEARNAGDFAPLQTIFSAAWHLVETLGHSETLSIWVTEAGAEIAWPLHQDGRHAAMRDFLKSIEPFSEDLERHLRAGRAFGRQSVFADLMVFMASALRSADMPAHEQLVERESLLERGLAVCPIHRNTRVVLAGIKLQLAEWEINTTHRTDVARKLIDEAAVLRPEHADLERLRQRLTMKD